MPVFSVTKKYKPKWNFRVVVPGFGDASFMSCSPIKPEIAKNLHWEGGSRAPQITLGRVTHPDVTLKRGATDSLDFWNWFKSAAEGDDEPRQIDVIELDRKNKELRRWSLWDCLPVSYSAGEWDNNSDENTVEELVVAVRFATLGGDNPV